MSDTPAAPGADRSAGEEDLLQWARDHGAIVNVQFYHSPDGVRGLAAAADFPPKACLLQMPSHMALPMAYTDSAYAAPVLLREVLWHRARHNSCQPPHDAHTCTEPPAVAGWTPRTPTHFIRSLPDKHELLTAYNMPAAAIPLLCCPELERIVRVLQARVSRVLSTGTAGGSLSATVCRGAAFTLSLSQAEEHAAAAARHPEPGASVGLGPQAEASQPAELATHDDVAWAASLLCSRTFQSSLQGVMVMVSLMDMINHVDDDPSAYVDSSSESESDAGSDVGSGGSDDEDVDVRSEGGQATGVSGSRTSSRKAGVVEGQGVKARGSGTKQVQQEVEPRPSQADTGSGWVNYHRRNSIYTRTHVRRGQEVHFTYHKGLRNDEMLIYYGFMTPARGQPLLLAVDHHEYKAVKEDPVDGELYDEYSQLIIDPLDGEWRGSPRLFNGAGQAVSREIRRLQALLQQHHQLCESRCLNDSATGTAAQRMQAGEGEAGDGGLWPDMPWLPGLMADFRQRRRAALEGEIARLQAVERVTCAARDLVAAARGISKLSFK